MIKGEKQELLGFRTTESKEEMKIGYNLAAAGLSTTQRDPAPVVNTFTSFSQHRASLHGTAQSISQLTNCKHPETLTRTPAGGPPDDEDSSRDGDDDGTPGRNPPDDFGGDPDNEPDNDPDNGPDNNDDNAPDNNNNGLNPQDRVFHQEKLYLYIEDHPLYSPYSTPQLYTVYRKLSQCYRPV
ncbi:uncharacterized protein EDB91DRAFT_1078122 [Suillus paluster]|uniref:uncharacterized protein n=1 Tax=Suillus paluster TaxID=48578 RepID=UPI001B867EC0|nr:uncharacterized protein EDB91DRAFT_1078122 [Suillus paluster]KAG1751309.1 hypothetical protein EDB91DRAFT_1078122 [Suillus paluster]